MSLTWYECIFLQYTVYTFISLPSRCKPGIEPLGVVERRGEAPSFEPIFLASYQGLFSYVEMHPAGRGTCGL